MSKLLRSRDVSPEQPENIPAILVTIEVSKLLRSKDVSPEQPLNILFITVTLEVSQPLRSIDVSAEQPLNILFIPVTFEVFIYSTLYRYLFCENDIYVGASPVIEEPIVVVYVPSLF